MEQRAIRIIKGCIARRNWMDTIRFSQDEWVKGSGSYRFATGLLMKPLSFSCAFMQYLATKVISEIIR